MSRYMWILAALIAIIFGTHFYMEEFGGGVERPWMQCKESLVQQMFSSTCTPSDRGGGALERPPLEPNN
ncbi:MAG: hypothetical protein O2985_13835 [Proteobacteria bacterium]|nr:hypothetical protein [Pseudomonadota bacterium]